MQTTTINPGTDYTGPAVNTNPAFAKIINDAKVTRALFNLTAADALNRTCAELLNDAALIARRSLVPADVKATWAEIETVAADAKAPATATHADAIAALEHCQNPDHAYVTCNH